MLVIMLMATTDTKITQIGTLSVVLEVGRWLSLERVAKNICCTCFTYILWQIKMYRSNEIAIAVNALQLKATSVKTTIVRYFSESNCKSK